MMSNEPSNTPPPAITATTIEAATSAADEHAGSEKRGLPIHRRLYQWVLAWADHKHAAWALFIIAFAESSFFPIPPDVLLIPLVLGRASKAMRFATICLAGSVLGGILGYVIGWGFWSATQDLFFKLPGVTPAKFDQVAGYFDSMGVWFVLFAGFTPFPYKVITIAAGVFHISFLPFLLGSFVGRGARFFLVAGLLKKFGPWAQPYIDKHFNKLALAFGVLLIGGFVAMKYLMH